MKEGFSDQSSPVNRKAFFKHKHFFFLGKKRRFGRRNFEKNKIA